MRGIGQKQKLQEIVSVINADRATKYGEFDGNIIGSGQVAQAPQSILDIQEADVVSVIPEIKVEPIVIAGLGKLPESAQNEVQQTMINIFKAQIPYYMEHNEKWGLQEGFDMEGFKKDALEVATHLMLGKRYMQDIAYLQQRQKDATLKDAGIGKTVRAEAATTNLLGKTVADNAI